MRLLSICIAIPISVFGCLTFFEMYGSIDEFSGYVYAATAMICAVMLGLWVVPHLRSDQVARFVVTHDVIQCDFPSVKYEIRMSDVVGVNIIRTTS